MGVVRTRSNELIDKLLNISSKLIITIYSIVLFSFLGGINNYLMTEFLTPGVFRAVD